MAHSPCVETCLKRPEAGGQPDIAWSAFVAPTLWVHVLAKILRALYRVKGQISKCAAATSSTYTCLLSFHLTS